MKELPAHPFERCGAAAVSDLQSTDCKDLFAKFERAQKLFVAREREFRSPDYPWPLDPLHTWSRIWEYPYAYHHLRKWMGQRNPNEPACAVDVGSGVTFFPFEVARLGFHVICTDVAPVCERDMMKAIPLFNVAPGRVEYRAITEERLPLRDGEADIVFCISVIEHIPDFENTVREMHRILKPGGQLILTIDMAWDSGFEIQPVEYMRLRGMLDRWFQLCFEETTIHPADLLRSDIGPYRERGVTGWRLPWFLVKQRVIKPLFGRVPRPHVQRLSVWAGVLRKAD